MSNQTKIALASCAAVACTVTLLVAVNQPKSHQQQPPVLPSTPVAAHVPAEKAETPMGTERPTMAGTVIPDKRDAGAPPTVSIVFVIDGSPNMYHNSGASAFELAKAGIADLLRMPGFPDDGTIEIAVIQNTRAGALGYKKDVHWLGRTTIGETPGGLAPEDLALRVEDLHHSNHHSAALIESGIKEAVDMLQGVSSLDNRTFSAAVSQHVILMTNGAWLLPGTEAAGECPPACYVWETCAGTWCDASAAPTCEDRGDICLGVECAAGAEELCHYESTDTLCDRGCELIDLAKLGRRNAGVRISALHMGRMARHQDVNLVTEFVLRSVTEAQELGGKIGEYARINPQRCYGCGITDWRPPVTEDVSSTLAGWLCTTSFTDDQYLADSDLDGPDGVLDLCDICPAVANADQADCNWNGIGDACENTSLCPNGDPTIDSDGDGICDGQLDRCPGGDDCLVAQWASASDCDPFEACGCDCDHNGTSDYCLAAQELAAVAETYCDTDVDCTTGQFDKQYEYYCRDFPYSPICNHRPTDCGLDLFTGYVEDFEDDGVFEDGPIDNKAGWVGPAAPGVFEVGDCDAGSGRCLQMHASPSYDTVVSAASPILDIPWWECKEALDLGQDCEDPENVVPCRADPHGWGVIAVEMEFAIPAGGDRNVVYDLSLVDGCPVSVSGQERLQLRVARAGTSDEWYVSHDYGDCASECNVDDSDRCEVKRFSDGEIVHVTVLFNDAVNYEVGTEGEDVCTFAPTEYENVKILFEGGSGCAGSTAFVGPAFEGGAAIPHDGRDIQFFLTADGRACATDCAMMEIRKIVARRSDHCEYANDSSGLDCSYSDMLRVCGEDSFYVCGSCGAVDSGNCWEAHEPLAGCSERACCEVVCREEPTCCLDGEGQGWTDVCAELAGRLCPS